MRKRIFQKTSKVSRVIEDNCPLNNAYDVADYILYYETKHGRSVNNLRMIKLLYFVQAKFLQDFGKPCFDEEIVAWDYGPAIPAVYRRYKAYGANRIQPSHFKDIGQSEELLAKAHTITELLDEASDFSTQELNEISCTQEPWIKRYKTEDETITLSDMREFFCVEDDHAK